MSGREPITNCKTLREQPGFIPWTVETRPCPAEVAKIIPPTKAAAALRSLAEREVNPQRKSA